LLPADANEADSDDDVYANTEPSSSANFKHGSAFSSRLDLPSKHVTRDGSANNRLSAASLVDNLRNSKIYLSLSRSSLPLKLTVRWVSP